MVVVGGQCEFAGSRAAMHVILIMTSWEECESDNLRFFKPKHADLFN